MSDAQMFALMQFHKWHVVWGGILGVSIVGKNFITECVPDLREAVRNAISLEIKEI